MAVTDPHSTMPASHPTSVRTPGPREVVAAARRVVHARSEDGLLTWSYTIGLREAYQHPELLITGLDPFLAESVLSQLIEQVAQGHTFHDASSAKDILHRLTCAFRAVPSAMASVLMPVAHATAHAESHVEPNGDSIHVLQCVYPDHKNRLPWHLGYNNSWHEVQPIFNFESPLTRIEINLLQAASGIHRPAAQHLVTEIY